MKKFNQFALIFVLLASSAFAADEAGKIRVVNFKSCVETSKVGKQEQASFEALKKQMENNLSEREKSLNEMASKFEDQDYLDSLSPDAETELKRKFRTLNQEYTQLQSQYLQALQQTNMKIVQRLTEIVSKAAATVAQKNNIDFIINDEAAFYANKAKDVSKEVVAAMDDLYEKDATMKESTVPSLPATSK